MVESSAKQHLIKQHWSCLVYIIELATTRFLVLYYHVQKLQQ